MRRGLSAELVVLAAADLADEIGFDAVTISAVARRLEVRTPSLYSHLAGSTDLRTRICALALDELADRATKAVAGCAARDAVAALLATHHDYGRLHPGRYAAMRLRLPTEAGGQASSALDDAVGAALAAARRHGDLLRAVLRDYRLGAEDEVHAVRLLGSLVQGFVTLDLAGGFEHSAPPSEVSRRYVVDAFDAMLSAMLSRPR